MNQYQTPLFDRLESHVRKKPISFHVPGHKSGKVFPEGYNEPFKELLAYDLTELPYLDDLHQPEDAIFKAEQLAAHYYGVDRTFFLVNGSTSGNLAMVLSVCKQGEKVLVQRNSHKSIMHALELSGAKPVFITPEYDSEVSRYSYLNVQTVKQAIKQHPDVQAVILTYPDYYGTTYDLMSVIEEVHTYDLPVLVDEAHGAHFALGSPFPQSAIDCGADIVVHSAHKTLPAMTMGSYLHVQSSRVSLTQIKYYLQMVQSSSPSYPIMASLDLARNYIATFTEEQKTRTLKQVEEVRSFFEQLESLKVLPIRYGVDDPLKITITSNTKDMGAWYHHLYHIGIHAEMVDNNQLLLIHGLGDNQDLILHLKQLIQEESSIPFLKKDDKIDKSKWENSSIQGLPYSYQGLSQLETEWVNWEQAIERVAAETITPYPPGIPVLLKGERISEQVITLIKDSLHKDHYVQYSGMLERLKQGMVVYKEE
ncbi:aminotransferase class I/II-fold pyridoxal phosphate-dependent enzyme [Alkalibacillus aidingensis]|uniref:aminotransferase class I/II-fold pyridoxal phosphate-dependent enzyme n=1 Tax=Alkalibacillus aidingensis TaxID=2747607 RepID=UPI001660C331|nr:aminotransferase class I/II-fold pyridoxal phosphate-dependent enzyme [Alkalibacillus aidingensis]